MKRTCSKCQGRGVLRSYQYVGGFGPRDCDRCKGTGYIKETKPNK